MDLALRRMERGLRTMDLRLQPMDGRLRRMERALRRMERALRRMERALRRADRRRRVLPAVVVEGGKYATGVSHLLLGWFLRGVLVSPQERRRRLQDFDQSDLHENSFRSSERNWRASRMSFGRMSTDPAKPASEWALSRSSRARGRRNSSLASLAPSRHRRFTLRRHPKCFGTCRAAGSFLRSRRVCRFGFRVRGGRVGQSCRRSWRRICFP